MQGERRGDLRVSKAKGTPFPEGNRCFVTSWVATDASCAALAAVVAETSRRVQVLSVVWNALAVVLVHNVAFVASHAVAILSAIAAILTYAPLQDQRTYRRMFRLR